MRIALHEGQPSLTALVSDVLGRAHDLSTVPFDGQQLPAGEASCDLVVVIWPERPVGRRGAAEHLRAVQADHTLVVLPHELTADRLGLVDIGVDYVVHPFHPLELIRRAEGRRRTDTVRHRVLRVGDVVVDEGARQAERANEQVALTKKEFDLLAHLVRNQDLVQDRSSLLESVWQSTSYNPNVVEVVISGLRQKLERLGPRIIHTVRGVGYVCRAAPSDAALGVAEAGHRQDLLTERQHLMDQRKDIVRRARLDRAARQRDAEDLARDTASRRSEQSSSGAEVDRGGRRSAVDLGPLLAYLRQVRSLDAVGGDRAALRERIERRMREVGAADVSAYLDQLEAQPREVTELVDAVLVDVLLPGAGRLFDDRVMWDHLAAHVVPALVDRVSNERPVRIWSAGCGSGQEVYTLVVQLAEALGGEMPSDLVRIFATDIDDDAIAVARRACYTAREVAEVPPEVFHRYLEPATSEDPARYVVGPQWRSHVTFGRHDLTRDPPIQRVDLLLCRNTLVYFDPHRRREAMHRLRDALTDDGLLVLGGAESPLVEESSFEVVDGPVNLARPVRPPRTEQMDAQVRGDHDAARAETLSELAFAVGAIARAVIDDRGVLVLANDAARELLHLTEHDLGRPLHELDLSRHPVDLEAALGTAISERRPVGLGVVPSVDPLGVTSQLEVRVTPLAKSPDDPVIGAVVAFADVTRDRDLHAQLAAANHELGQVYEELQLTNAEVRSTNDEFETMNDELQAVTDELQLRSRAFRERSVELDAARREPRSRSSSPTALVAVDGDLRVLTWSSGAQGLWGVGSSSVVGASLVELGIELMHDLDAPIRSVLEGAIDEQTVDLAAVDGWGAPARFRVSCSPLRLPSGDVEGVVLLIESEPSPPVER